MADRGLNLKPLKNPFGLEQFPPDANVPIPQQNLGAVPAQVLTADQLPQPAPSLNRRTGETSERAIRESTAQPSPTDSPGLSVQTDTVAPVLDVQAKPPLEVQQNTQAPQLNVPSQPTARTGQGGEAGGTSPDATGGTSPDQATGGTSPDAAKLTKSQDEETKDRARRNQSVLDQLASEPGAARFLFDLGTGILSQGLVEQGESALGQIGTAAQEASQRRRNIQAQQEQEARQDRRLDLQKDRIEARAERQEDRQEFEKKQLEKRLSAQKERLVSKLKIKNSGIGGDQAIDLMKNAVEAYQKEREAVCGPVQGNKEACQKLSSPDGKRDFISDFIRGTLGLSGDFQISKADANKTVREVNKAKVEAGERLTGRQLRNRGVEVPDDELDSVFVKASEGQGGGEEQGQQEGQSADGGQSADQGQKQQEERSGPQPSLEVSTNSIANMSEESLRELAGRIGVSTTKETQPQSAREARTGGGERVPRDTQEIRAEVEERLTNQNLFSEQQLQGFSIEQLKSVATELGAPVRKRAPQKTPGAPEFKDLPKDEMVKNILNAQSINPKDFPELVRERSQ